MDDRKVQITFRMDETTNYLIKTLYEQDNCASQNEFIEKAIKFYASYLNTNKNIDAFNSSLFTAIKGAIKENESKVSSNLTKIAIEISMMMNIIAKTTNLPKDYLRRLRAHCMNRYRVREQIIL